MGSITMHRDTTLPRGPNVVKINNDMETRLTDLRTSSKHEQPTFVYRYDEERIEAEMRGEDEQEIMSTFIDDQAVESGRSSASLDESNLDMDELGSFIDEDNDGEQPRHSLHAHRSCPDELFVKNRKSKTVLTSSDSDEDEFVPKVKRSERRERIKSDDISDVDDGHEHPAVKRLKTSPQKG
ncbi:hypothetical protein QR680_011415 [Steinernema hermaphroditum]|uniref:Uncharacterized protein n=1 Tax=Steinernema hermaphroditum TaxID=289476 RepID=A0AA39I0U9_9BILA|nr:hypothetical protein QR680_011415 [Steinernema hermaphroditum]